MSVFSNTTIQLTLNKLNGNSSFSQLAGFGIYSSPNTTHYYVMDYFGDKVYILNDDWSFISFKSFYNPTCMISMGLSLYMIGAYNVWKVDQNLNILINYNPGGTPGYLGISYNPSNNLLYVVAQNIKEIQVFNSNLTLIRRFFTSPHYLWSITESSNKLYVGTYNTGMILVYQNEILINRFNGCNGNSDWLTSILFDQTDYMATTCYNLNKLYLYSQNGSFTGKSITTPSYPSYIGFDSKGRFIQISYYQISIYK